MPDSRELKRKAVHIAMGGFAFLLRFLSWPQAAVLAAVALLHNLFLFPRYGGRGIYREAARERGHDPGIALYPASVLALTLIFRNHLPIVAAAWGFLAFGDGLATVGGITLGRLTGALPWNRRKSWAGLITFFVAGTAAAWWLLEWTARGDVARYPPLAIVVVVGAAVALIESLPLGVDDNIAVPLAAAGLLYAGLLVDLDRLAAGYDLFVSRWPLALGVNLVLGVAAYAARSVDLSGLIHGALLGTALWVFGGWPAFLMLVAFFVLGTAATKVGHRIKLAEGTAQEKGGRRGAPNAWANVGAGTLFAFLLAATVHPALFALAIVAAFATATSDTLGSEIGQAYGRRTFLITTFKPVPRGTDGAVSLEGTLAGIAGSLVVGGLAWAVHLIDGRAIGVVAAAAFVGTTLESYLGAWLEQAKAIDNEAQNLLNTLVGGLTAIALASMWGALNP